jgi:hypothetical protein
LRRTRRVAAMKFSQCAKTRPHDLMEDITIETGRAN